MLRQPPFSVVIPTLWRPKTFTQLLIVLNESPNVREIIVIDNAPNLRPPLPHLPKTKLVAMGSNLFVNASWNLGVALAESESVCICNDDVLFDQNIMEYMRTQSLHRITGLHPSSYTMTNEDPRKPIIQSGSFIKNNWGSILFLRKQHYQPIPESMKIWWGDAWLAQKLGPPQALKAPVFTEHSVSAGSPEFKAITNSDTHIWQTQYAKPPKMSQRVASFVQRVRRKLKR